MQNSMKISAMLAIVAVSPFFTVLAHAEKINCEATIVESLNNGSRPGAVPKLLATATFDSNDSYSSKNEKIMITANRFISLTPIGPDLWMNISEQLGDGSTRTSGTHVPFTFKTAQLVDEVSRAGGSYTQYRLDCKK